MMSPAIRYNIQTLIMSGMAATAAGISAASGWSAWAMFLGWVAALTVGPSLQEICRSYACLFAGIWIGAAGTILVADLRPSIGPFADALAVLGMATTIASTRKLPLFNVVPSYILGVIGIFALHPTAIGVAVAKIAAPSAIGAIGVWLARLALASFASPGPDPGRPESRPS
jgi:Protein of unknown function (DUF1097)